MRKPTYNEVYMYKNFFWLSIGCFVIIPILNNFFLQIVILFTDGNIAYGALSSVVSVVRDIFALAGNYCGIAILIITTLHFGENAAGVAITALLSRFVTFFASIFTYVLYGGEYFYTAFLMLIIDLVINEAVYIAIYVISRVIAKKDGTVLNVPPYPQKVISFKHPVFKTVFIGAVVFFGVQLISLVVRMIKDFTDPSLGLPVTLGDKLYWVLEYFSLILDYVLGYGVMILTVFLAVRYLNKSFKKLLAK